mmetsp:Transcript_6936/g.10978  ORF Transcript_6936/g.10978 Transcript_6936/m.10978 type:complete len:614 (+) Transcript_6936:152-1993(+)
MGLAPVARFLEETPGNSTVEEIEEVEKVEFLTITLFICTLLFSQLLCSLWKRTRLNVFPEAGMLLLLGVIIGGLIKVTERSDVVYAVEKLSLFDANLFFMVLLPPIIFDSGFTLRREVFFGNFGAIISLAVFGTILSSIVVGATLYAFSSLGWIYPATKLECLLFGSIISATDPVSVIAVFHRIGVKPSLLVLVFGESVLNDAVALVLYRTLLLIQESAETDGTKFSTVFSAVLEFVKSLVGSTLIGLLWGVLSALFFKLIDLRQKDYRLIESAIAFLLPYASYTFAAGVEMSGIVSMLFTGIFMASYTRHNLSPESAVFLQEIYHFLAHISETFIFIYLGMSVFTGDGKWSRPAISFGFVSVAACILGRAVAIIPICTVVNSCRSRARRISKAEIFVLWYSGLRGGMAFALSASSVDEIGNTEVGRVFESATTIVVFVTVFVCGSSILCILHKFDLVQEGVRSPLSSPAFYNDNDVSKIGSPGFSGDGSGFMEAVYAARGYTSPAPGDGPTAFTNDEVVEIELVQQPEQQGVVEPPPPPIQVTEVKVHNGPPLKAGDRLERLWNRLDNKVLRPFLIRGPGSTSSVMDSTTNPRVNSGGQAHEDLNFSPIQES